MTRRLAFGIPPNSLDPIQQVKNLMQASQVSQPQITIPQLTPYIQFVEAKKSKNRVALKQLTGTSLHEELPAIVTWWLSNAVTSNAKTRERMTLLWHGHFATSIQKVIVSSLMANQNQLQRRYALESFSQLTHGISIDPAMMIWLDTIRNTSGAPNENFGRELMELFTFGVGNYTQSDVVSAARSFTGWRFNPTDLSFFIDPRLHDFGTKTFLGQSGTFNGDQIIDIILSTKASARFVAAKVFSHLAYPITPNDPIANSLAENFSPATTPISQLLTDIVSSNAFSSPQTLTGLTKEPFEYLVGALTALKIDPSTVPKNRVVAALRTLGQVPFLPPNVGGWPENRYFVSTSTTASRIEVINYLLKYADISAIEQAAPSTRVETATTFLNMAPLSQPTLSLLSQRVNDPKALIAAALAAPEYINA
ncbi:MAG: DUF1800 domain-containing protein [Actinomycetota bacterium]|nr:DUF1800 domain-containing protein [Actinomycetota bacterium]